MMVRPKNRISLLLKIYGYFRTFGLVHKQTCIEVTRTPAGRFSHVVVFFMTYKELKATVHDRGASLAPSHFPLNIADIIATDMIVRYMRHVQKLSRSK
jgi:hypothetical protein